MIYCLRYLVVLSRGVMGCPLLPPEAARFLLFLSPGYDRMWAKGGDTFDGLDNIRYCSCWFSDVFSNMGAYIFIAKAKCRNQNY